MVFTLISKKGFGSHSWEYSVAHYKRGAHTTQTSIKRQGMMWAETQSRVAEMERVWISKLPE